MTKVLLTVAALALAGMLVAWGSSFSPAKGSAQGAAPTSAAVEAEAPADLPAEYRKITAEEAKARMESDADVRIVDVRTPEEFAAGRIPGAINIPNEGILDEMPPELPDAHAEILLYCRSGRRSSDAAHKLLAMGYTAVYDFGGIIDWPYEVER